MSVISSGYTDEVLSNTKSICEAIQRLECLTSAMYHQMDFDGDEQRLGQSVNVTVELTVDSKTGLCIFRGTVDSYTGGAHPNHHHRIMLLDYQSGRQVTLADLLEGNYLLFLDSVGTATLDSMFAISKQSKRYYDEDEISASKKLLSTMMHSDSNSASMKSQRTSWKRERELRFLSLAATYQERWPAGSLSDIRVAV